MSGRRQPRGSTGTAAPARRSGPTIADVADRADVSRATAARALGGYGAVSPEVRSRVHRAAGELGYRVNGPARSIVKGRTDTLGAVLPDVENPFFARVLRGITDVARAEGFEVLVANTDERADRERASLEQFIGNRVDGVVVAPASPARVEHLVSAWRAGLPLVLVERPAPALAVDTVLVDNVAAARDAVARLLDGGHRRIAMVAGTRTDGGDDPLTGRGSATTDEWIAGYRQGLADAGLTARPEFVRTGTVRREDGCAVAGRLLALSEPPTAVLTTDSVLALGVLQGVRAGGLATPDDVSLVSFGDTDWASIVDPPLTVVEQPGHALGVAAARRLIARARGDAAPVETRRLRTTWIDRGSTARLHP